MRMSRWWPSCRPRRGERASASTRPTLRLTWEKGKPRARLVRRPRRSIRRATTRIGLSSAFSSTEIPARSARFAGVHDGKK
jgi:hypothetical protein